MIPITFTNIDSEPFTGKWNSREYTIPAGKTLKLPDELARHFAKHLINKILHRAGKQVNHTGDKDCPGKEALLKKINPNLKWHERYHSVGINYAALKISDAPGGDARIALLNAESENRVDLNSEVPILDAKPDHEEPIAPPAPQGNPDPASEDYEPEPDFTSADPEPKDEADSNPEDADEDNDPSESDFENANQ